MDAIICADMEPQDLMLNFITAQVGMAYKAENRFVRHTD
jgi:hypothetical protein